MDAMKVLKALRSKTVERGCSKDEAEQALAMASRLSAKHGIDLKEVDRQLELDGMSRRQRMRVENGVVDLSDLIRKSRAARYAAPPSQPMCDHKRREGCPEFWRCVKCSYCFPSVGGFYKWRDAKHATWAKKQNKKASRKGTGCSNPFGVHGKGVDQRGMFESVADYVMRMLEFTDMSFDEIAKGSREIFGGKTSKNSVAWYVNKMKKQGRDYARVNAAGDIRRS